MFGSAGNYWQSWYTVPTLSTARHPVKSRHSEQHDDKICHLLRHKQLWASTHTCGVSGLVPNASVPLLLVGLPRLSRVRLPIWKTRRSALKQGDSDLGSNWEIRMLLRFVNCLCGEIERDI